MHDYDFELCFDLPDTEQDPGEFVESLYVHNCNDALIGIGRPGRIALAFTRTSVSAQEAIFSAISDVQNSVPGAVLREAEPDLVGLTDMARILGFSRQNMRKLVITNSPGFPLPVHEGKPSIWHLAKVLTWLKVNKNYPIDDALLEVAKTNMQLNLIKEISEIEPSFRKEVQILLA